MGKNYKFETMQIHVGQEKPDPATDARAVPIYMTTSYVFRDSAQAAARFDLKEEGALIRKAVDASLDAYVRTPEIQVEGQPKYGTKEVGAWVVDYIKKA